MNAHHNQEAYLCIIVVIMIDDDILTLLKCGVSGTDDRSLVLMLFFMDIYNCKTHIQFKQKNAEISDLLFVCLWLRTYIQLEHNKHIARI